VVGWIVGVSVGSPDVTTSEKLEDYDVNRTASGFPPEICLRVLNFNKQIAHIKL
jgi:hypothetical protein